MAAQTEQASTESEWFYWGSNFNTAISLFFGSLRILYSSRTYFELLYFRCYVMVFDQRWVRFPRILLFVPVFILVIIILPFGLPDAGHKDPVWSLGLVGLRWTIKNCSGKEWIWGFQGKSQEWATRIGKTSRSSSKEIWKNKKYCFRRRK